VIFVVDAVDNKFITEIMEEDPAFFDEYKDFTMYSDTCSVYDLTTHSIPQMLLGYTYLTEYNPKGGLFLTRLKDNGFRILFFNVFAGLEKQYVDNYEDMSETGDMFWIDYPRIRSDLLKTSIFQSLPCLAKSVVGIEEIKYLYYVRYDKDEYEMVANDKLFREKLDLSYNENSDKCLYYHHLDGAHYPCKDFVGETKFCLDSFKEYMRQMKELGVYDDATLIVCSDHGRHDDDGEYPFPTAATPMFMIKKKNETHDSMVITSTPMYFMDFQSTVLAASGYFNPETDYEIFGKSIYDYDETSIRKRVWFDTDFHIRDIHKYTYVGDMKELERVVNAGEYEIVDSWAFEYEE
jgi:hypothetical protein